MVKPIPLLVPALVVTVVFRVRRDADNGMWNTAVIVVAFTTTTLLTLTAPPCTATVAGAVKCVPVSVTLTLLPRVPEFGVSELSTGFAAGAGFTVKETLPLVPPRPVTVTLRAPVEALAAIANVAVILVELATVMFDSVTPLPLTATVAPLAKLDPVSVTATFVPCIPLFGEIELSAGGVTGVVTVTVDVPIAEGDATLAACTVTVPEGAVAGAVNSPAVEITPTVEFPPGAPFTLQSTSCTEEFATVAENCFVVPTGTVALAGVTVTVTVVDCFACPELGSIIRPETSTASKSEPLSSPSW